MWEWEEEKRQRAVRNEFCPTFTKAVLNHALLGSTCSQYSQDHTDLHTFSHTLYCTLTCNPPIHSAQSTNWKGWTGYKIQIWLLTMLRVFLNSSTLFKKHTDIHWGGTIDIIEWKLNHYTVQVRQMFRTYTSERKPSQKSERIAPRSMESWHTQCFKNWISTLNMWGNAHEKVFAEAVNTYGYKAEREEILPCFSL